MASHLLKFHPLAPPPPHPPRPRPILISPFHLSSSATPIVDIPARQNALNGTVFYVPKLYTLPVRSSLSDSPAPPGSREDAVLQARTSLETALQKPLNNPMVTGKFKKQKQQRYRVEIPVADCDSPDSVVQLASDVIGNLKIRRKGRTVIVLLVWPNPAMLASGTEAFKDSAFARFEHVDLTTVDHNRVLNSADVAAFIAPSSSQLAAMKLVSDRLFPRPLVLFNPRWQFEEEARFGDTGTFVGSFDVVYAFVGLEVRGILSRKTGVVFKYVRDGVVSSERWSVLVEEDGNRLRVVSRFKTRPSITEVENVLYNLMAVNSPITKSAKFLRDFVSNVTGKKTT